VDLALARLVRDMVEAAPVERDPAAPTLHDQVVGAAERALAIAVLEQVHWNQRAAAEIMGINRNTLRQILRRHGVVVHAPPVPHPLTRFAPLAAAQGWR